MGGANRATLLGMYVVVVATVALGAGAGVSAESPAETQIAWDEESRTLSVGENETVIDLEHPERMNESVAEANESSELEGDSEMPDWWDEEQQSEPAFEDVELPGSVERFQNATLRGYLGVMQRTFIDAPLRYAVPMADRAATWAYHTDWVTHDHVNVFGGFALVAPFAGSTVRDLWRLWKRERYR